MSRRKNVLLEAIEYGAYRAASLLVSRASRETVLRWGTRLGNAGRRVLRRRSRLALKNLRAAFPDKSDAELRSVLEECWRHFGREMLLFVRMQSASLESIAEQCRFVNAQILQEAQSRGRGVVLISAHYGSWEVAGLALLALVGNVRTVTRPLDNRFLERDLARLRVRTGAAVIDRRRAARALMKGLAENAVVGLLPDQAVQPREGVLVPFMGRNAWTTPAPAKIALRAGSPIVFVFCIPDERGHRLEFEEPIRIDQLLEAERNPVVLTARINDIISRRIASRPELWLWMHDRWKGSGNG